MRSTPPRVATQRDISSTEAPRNLRRSRLFPALAALTMAAVCAFRLGARGTWRDEHATWWAATLDARAFWHLLDNVDMVLAPYYLLMRGWVTVFGTSPTALRAPSAIAMTCCAVCTYFLGKRLFDPTVGLLASLFLATIPSVCRYGQEARPYAFAMAFTVLSITLLLRALERPGSVARWIGYAAGVVLTGGSHLLALASLCAHAVYVVDARPRFPWICAAGGRRVFLRWFSAVAGAALTLAPLIWAGRQQSAQIAWTLELDAKLFAFPQLVFHARNVGLLVIALALLALRRAERARLALGLWAVGCPLFLYATHDVLHFYVHRYMMFTLPAWALLAAAALAELAAALSVRLQRRSVAIVLPAAVLALSLVLGANARDRQHNAARVGTRTLGEAAEHLAAEALPDDGVAFAGEQTNWLRMGLRYELRDRTVPRDVFVSSPPRERGSFLALECASSIECLPASLQRLWLLTSGPEADPLARVGGERRRLLLDQFALDHVARFSKVTVALLVRRQAQSSPRLPGAQ